MEKEKIIEENEPKFTKHQTCIMRYIAWVIDQLYSLKDLKYVYHACKFSDEEKKQLLDEYVLFMKHNRGMRIDSKTVFDASYGLQMFIRYLCLYCNDEYVKEKTGRYVQERYERRKREQIFGISQEIQKKKKRNIEQCENDKIQVSTKQECIMTTM